MKSKTPRILIAISALVLVAGIVSIYLFSKTLRNDSTKVYITTIGDYKFNKALGRIEEYIGTENEIEIPSEIDGVAVSSIDGSAFSNIYKYSSIRSITIPDSVTNIESTAFSGCRSLEKITVNKDNICYSEVNGILFDKQQTTLVYYPTGRKSQSQILCKQEIVQ